MRNWRRRYRASISSSAGTATRCSAIRLNAAGKEVYPARLKSKTGEPVLVVQAGEYSKYVGRLNVVFDDKGLVTSATATRLRSIGTSHLIQRWMRWSRNCPGQSRTEKDGSQSHERRCGHDRDRVEQQDLPSRRVRAWQPDHGFHAKETNAQIAIENGGGIRGTIAAGRFRSGAC